MQAEVLQDGAYQGTYREGARLEWKRRASFLGNVQREMASLVARKAHMLDVRWQPEAVLGRRQVVMTGNLDLNHTVEGVDELASGMAVLRISRFGRHAARTKGNRGRKDLAKRGDSQRAGRFPHAGALHQDHGSPWAGYPGGGFQLSIDRISLYHSKQSRQ